MGSYLVTLILRNFIYTTQKLFYFSNTRVDRQYNFIVCRVYILRPNKIRTYFSYGCTDLKFVKSKNLNVHFLTRDFARLRRSHRQGVFWLADWTTVTPSAERVTK